MNMLEYMHYFALTVTRSRIKNIPTINIFQTPKNVLLNVTLKSFISVKWYIFHYDVTLYGYSII